MSISSRPDATQNWRYCPPSAVHTNICEEPPRNPQEFFFPEGHLHPETGMNYNWDTFSADARIYPENGFVQTAGPWLSDSDNVVMIQAAGASGAVGIRNGADESLDFKIGQMLMVGFRGLTASDNPQIFHDIAKYNLGGVVLYDYDVPTKSPLRNIESSKQLRELTGKLQSASAVPLFIAIDQEGGRISRLKSKRGFSEALSAQKLGNQNDLNLTRANSKSIADLLAEHGINLNLAPVVDLNVNPKSPAIGMLERSFSPDPEVVSNHAAEFIKAHRSRGVLTALKHFPGHGSSTADSHHDFTDVTKTWSAKELFPYQRLISSGMADIVMTAHVFNSQVDPKFPATLSKKFINDMLRKKLGFAGVVISDDMQMGAIRQYYGFESSIESAIEAGVDIILISNNSVYDKDAAARAFNTIKKLVLDGKISAERIEQSYQRIRKLKKDLNASKKEQAENANESCLAASPAQLKTSEIKSCINRLIFEPDQSQTDKELLSIVVLRKKENKFNFLKGYTRSKARGTWREISRDGTVVKVYPDEDNVQIDVEFKCRRDEAVHKGLIRLLTEYNKREVREQLLYHRVTPIKDSSL